MKYLLILLMILALATGCKKSNCVQCAKQVASTTQTTTVTTTYDVQYLQFCGRQADTALSSDPGVSAAFVSEYNLTPYTCFIKN